MGVSAFGVSTCRRRSTSKCFGKRLTLAEQGGFTAWTPGAEVMAETWHISAELCRRFLEQRTSLSERLAVVRHLITQCPECLALMGRISAEGGYWFAKMSPDAYTDRTYAEAFQTAFKFATQAEREVAMAHLRGWGHWSALDRLRPSERLPAIVRRREWQHWGLFRAILDAARWYRNRDSQEAADIARLALDVADLLDPAGVGGEATAKDLKAKACSALSDCCRLASDLQGAREAIAQAWKLNEEGAGDPLDRA